MIKRVLEHTLSILIGGIVAMCTIIIAYHFSNYDEIKNADKMFDYGYKKGQQECIDLIKNTK